jgi:hypothetical protein
VAAGKEGNMFLLNQANLGGFNPTNSGSVGVVAIGRCFCGQSYFSDGVPHVVSSGAKTVNLWNLQTSPSVELVNAGSQTITSGQSSGFFTSISSSGSNDAIIWAVSHPLSTTNTGVTLYAINAQPSAGKLPILFNAVAGSWTHLTGDANIVPVVAGGHVYVASDKGLSIFGLLNGATAITIIPKPAVQSVSSSFAPNEIFGTISGISGINGSQITVQRRTGSLLTVDASIAIQNELSVGLEVGEPVDVQGTFNANGMLAHTIQRAKDSSDLWTRDH